MNMESQVALDTAFAALADPTRRAILARLSEGEATVNELAAPFHLSLPAVSKHIKVLEHAGLITRARHAQTRPCKLNPEGLRHAADWITQYRKLWEGGFGRHETFLAGIETKARGDDDPR